MKNGMQVNMQFLADALQKTCEKYVKHGDVKFIKREEDDVEEHINFENLMISTLKGIIKKRYSNILVFDMSEDIEDEEDDFIRFVPIDDIYCFYYNMPWASVMYYYENKMLYGVFVYDSMDNTVIFCNTREDDKNVRVYRNMTVNNFRARRISRGIYNISDIRSNEELGIIDRKQSRKCVAFFSPIMAVLNVLKGGLDGMAATVVDRRCIHAMCLICKKLDVAYTFKNDIMFII